MKLLPQQSLAVLMSITVFWCAMLPGRVTAAEPHVIDLSELQQQMRQSRQERAKNLEDLDRVLSLPAAREALAKARVDMARVRSAIAGLDDQELSRLAERARTAEQDVQGGLLIGLLALIGLIVVIIIVVSLVRD
jgi:hypothetical protein